MIRPSAALTRFKTTTMLGLAANTGTHDPDERKFLSDLQAVLDYLDSLEKARAALVRVIAWADELGCYAEDGTVLVPVLADAKKVLADE